MFVRNIRAKRVKRVAFLFRNHASALETQQNPSYCAPTNPIKNTDLLVKKYKIPPIIKKRVYMIRWMYSGNESQGFSSGVTLGVQKLLWAYPGVHFAFVGSYAHGDRVYRLRRIPLHLLTFFVAAYPGVHFASGASYAHGHRVHRLRHEILHNFRSNLA